MIRICVSIYVGNPTPVGLASERCFHELKQQNLIEYVYAKYDIPLDVMEKEEINLFPFWRFLFGYSYDAFLEKYVVKGKNNG